MRLTFETGVHSSLSVSPLVLMLSQNGVTFNRALLLRSGMPDDLPVRKYDGRYKTLGFSYPKAIVSNGNLYIGYSVNKEAVSCTVIPLDKLLNDNQDKH